MDRCRPGPAPPAPMRRVWLWLAGSALGVAVLALPDTGPRVFSFSEAHGPSAVDVVGIMVLVGAWLPVAALIWSGRRTLGRRGCLPAVMAATGVALLVVTIALNLGPAWMAAVAILLGAQILVLRALLAHRTGGRSIRSRRRMTRAATHGTERAETVRPGMSVCFVLRTMDHEWGRLGPVAVQARHGRVRTPCRAAMGADRGVSRVAAAAGCGRRPCRDGRIVRDDAAAAREPRRPRRPVGRCVASDASRRRGDGRQGRREALGGGVECARTRRCVTAGARR